MHDHNRRLRKGQVLSRINVLVVDKLDAQHTLTGERRGDGYENPQAPTQATIRRMDTSVGCWRGVYQTRVILKEPVCWWSMACHCMLTI